MHLHDLLCLYVQLPPSSPVQPVKNARIEERSRISPLEQGFNVYTRDMGHMTIWAKYIAISILLHTYTYILNKKEGTQRTKIGT